jgi:hypothetical protein
MQNGDAEVDVLHSMAMSFALEVLNAGREISWVVGDHTVYIKRHKSQFHVLSRFNRARTVTAEAVEVDAAEAWRTFLSHVMRWQLEKNSL